jgi:AmmeMemoRadiSam system protein A
MAATEPFVALARQALETYVTSQRVIATPDPVPADMRLRAGVFVSVHTTGGELRGCIGTVEPTTDSIAREIIQNAISAATRDPRFPPIVPTELGRLEVSVDVLSAPEACGSLQDLDPKRYGVIVQSGWRRGLLLPDLPGVHSAVQQVDIAMRKAGIHTSEPLQLQRFTVTRHQ